MQAYQRTLTRRDWTRILAFALRKNRTESERLVWQQLKGRQLLGFKFRQQAPIGHWIADFYCPAARLVVELDGACHRGRSDRDRMRDKAMAEMGLNVLRIRSSLVFSDRDSVIGQIEWALRCSGADPLTADDSLRLRLAEELWRGSEPEEGHSYLRHRLRGLGFQVPEAP